MAESKKIKYLSKTVSFGGKNLTLFSIDGQTWSSRKQELLEIKERQEQNKVSFAAIKEENGETRVIPKVKNKPAYGSSYEEEEVPAAVEDDEMDYPKTDYSLDEEGAPKGKKQKALKIKAKEEKQSKQLKAAPLAKKMKLKEKKKALKIVPKKRATGKPKVKAVKKAKRKAA